MYIYLFPYVRKTVLGPTFGSPVRKMEVFPSNDQYASKGYLAYITDDKVYLYSLTRLSY